MDLSKPINWKRQLKTNGAYGCMGDLGIHTQHLPFRLGFRGDSVSAQLANLVPQRPCGDGFAPCETYDNAILLCGAHNAAGDRFPMVMEMKRMAPGCTNTVEYEIYGLDGSAKFSTEDANAVWYTRNQGREQAWSRLILGQRTLFPVITRRHFRVWLFRRHAADVRGVYRRTLRRTVRVRLLPTGRGAFEPPAAHRRTACL